MKNPVKFRSENIEEEYFLQYLVVDNGFQSKDEIYVAL
jgi:hypothetical protein